MVARDRGGQHAVQPRGAEEIPAGGLGGESVGRYAAEVPEHAERGRWGRRDEIDGAIRGGGRGGGEGVVRLSEPDNQVAATFGFNDRSGETRGVVRPTRRHRQGEGAEIDAIVSG